jgi:hypothetical protein
VDDGVRFWKEKNKKNGPHSGAACGLAAARVAWAWFKNGLFLVSFREGGGGGVTGNEFLQPIAMMRLSDSGFVA